MAGPLVFTSCIFGNCFTPERLRAAQGVWWVPAEQQHESLGLLTFEAPAAKRRNTCATLDLPGTTADRKFLSSSEFFKCLRLQNWGILFWLRKEQPHNPQSALLALAW